MPRPSTTATRSWRRSTCAPRRRSRHRLARPSWCSSWRNRRTPSRSSIPSRWAATGSRRRCASRRRARMRAGEAHILFRLGYEPQVLQLAGVSVESFGKQVPLSALPTTQAADRRREHALVAAATAAATAALSGPPVEGGDLRLEVNAAQVLRPISPYVYGINSQAGRRRRRHRAPHGRQSRHRVQLGARRLQRRQRLQTQQRRLVVHGHGLRRRAANRRRNIWSSRHPTAVPAGSPLRRCRWSTTWPPTRTARSRRTRRRRASAGCARCRRSRRAYARHARSARRRRLRGRVRQLPGPEDGRGREGRHQVLRARQRAGAVAVDAPARASREDDLRRDGGAHDGDRRRDHQDRSRRRRSSAARCSAGPST